MCRPISNISQPKQRYPSPRTPWVVKGHKSRCGKRGRRTPIESKQEEKRQEVRKGFHRSRVITIRKAAKQQNREHSAETKKLRQKIQSPHQPATIHQFVMPTTSTTKSDPSLGPARSSRAPCSPSAAGDVRRQSAGTFATLRVGARSHRPRSDW